MTKQPDLVRRHVDCYLQRLLSYISCIPDNAPAADLLRGDDGLKRRARIVGYILSELGNESIASVEDPGSQVRRSVARLRGPRGGTDCEI